MGRHCFVTNCKSGYKSTKEKVSLFKPPHNALKEWKTKIARHDRNLTEKDSICEKHFHPDTILRVYDDGTVQYPLKKPRLVEGALPTIFPNCLPKRRLKKENPSKKRFKNLTVKCNGLISNTNEPETEQIVASKVMCMDNDMDCSSKMNYIEEVKHKASTNNTDTIFIKQEIDEFSDYAVTNIIQEELDIKEESNVNETVGTRYLNVADSKTKTETTNFSVRYLKTINFPSLSLEKKIEIRNMGRPKPELNLVQTTKCKSREFKRTFKNDIYEKNDWISGCSVTNRLFCFPCLLFEHGSAVSSWTKIGIMDLSHLAQKIKKHENSQPHINAQLEIRLLGKLGIRQQLDSVHRHNIQQHNVQVKKNRYALSKIIDCIKCCNAFEMALHGQDESDALFTYGMYRGLINFSAELDMVLKDHIEKATVFKGTSKNIQSDLLECMLQVCQEHIKKEISTAEFVSVITDETTDVCSTFQMVLVFRYVLSDGTPVERFWGFINPLDHYAVSLSESIKNILNQVLDRPQKLISQSCVMSGCYLGVPNLIQRDYQYAYNVHCYAHELNLILAQATSQNQQVRVFFSNLSDITNFFSHSPQRVAVLDEIVSHNGASPITWNFRSRIISTVYENKEFLIKCMEIIESTSKQTAAINQAGAIYRMLQDPEFVFWLTVFHRLMPYADILYKQLQKTTDPEQLHKAIKCFEGSIQKEKKNIGTVETETTEVTHFRKKRKNEEPYVLKIVAAKEVCDTITKHVNARFSFTNHLDASTLFLSENFPQFQRKFPSQYLNAIVDAYPFLDNVRLQTELELIYRRPDFRNMSGAVDLLKFIIENDLRKIFSATFTLLQILVTIPMATSEAERCFLTLKQIKTFLRSSMDQERLTALAMLSIEKKFIGDLTDFNEMVINKFATEKDRNMDFTLKHCT